jgi:poly(3-hydroxybutyrate) depolymerase
MATTPGGWIALLLATIGCGGQGTSSVVSNASGTGGSTGGGGAIGATGNPGEGGAPGNGGSNDAGGTSEAGGGRVADAGMMEVGPPLGGSGCGKTPPPLGTMIGAASRGTGADYSYSIDVGGTPRTYVLHLPAGYDPNHPYPVVFLFHGTGGSGAMFDYTRVEQSAPPGSAIFVLPDGLNYNAPSGNLPGWQTFNADDRDLRFFDALWEQLQASYCVDTKRVFASGHSIGGFMSNYLASQRGNVVRAAAPLAGGGLYPSYTRSHPQVGEAAVIILHGTADTDVPYMSGVNALNYFLGVNHCALASVPTDHPPCLAYQGCDAGFPVQMCTYEGVAHNLDWAQVGPIVWSFFASF